ncbi:cytochrome b [Thalassospira sp. MCCC 1A01428]|uniref:cytochrome b n=1 Tax=Thalassospira sp. MCCC 1A01428 TaxID=1470575 RepID=UPI000A1F9179|nr:cytochrome b [Thalassospira sp. MCCC 1A01428]
MSVPSQNLSVSASRIVDPEGMNCPHWVVPVLHWGMAVLIVAVFIVGKIMEDLPREQRLPVMGWHILFGLSVLILFLPRIIAVLANVRRQHAISPENIVKTNLAARIMQGVLYFLMLAVPLAGLTAMTTIGRNFSVLGLFSLPNFTANHELHELAENVHGTMATILIILAGAHAGAALWHHFVVKDNVLRRYLPGR